MVRHGDSDDEEYMSGSDEDMEYENSMSKVAGQIDNQGHLQAEDLYGVQTKIFTVRCQGSLEQLASNPAKATWKLSPEMQKLLRQVTTTTNRSKADEDQLVGDLSKAVILQSTVLQERSDYPIPIGLSIPGMVPQVYDSNSRYNWIVEKETPTTTVNQTLFEPDNLFTKYMYEKLEKLDIESLNNQIRFEKDPNAPHALMDPNGFAWQIMMKNVYQGNFPGVEQDLLEIHDSVQNNRNRAVFVKVPVDVAREVHAAIEQPLKSIESSFVDMRKFTCTFERADNQHWNSTQGLIGAAAAADQDTKNYLKANALNNEYSASVKIMIKYIVY